MRFGCARGFQAVSEKVYVPNTFPTPNVLIDAVMPVVSASAFKVLMVITRLTLGWRDNGGDLYQAVEIGIGGAHGLSKLTGLSHQSIISASRELLGFGLILVKKGPRNSRTANQYALNLDLTTGQLVQNLDQSKNLSSPTSLNFRPKLVKIFDSLINKGNKIHTAGRSRRKNSPADDPEFDTAWSLYPERAGDNPKEKARTAWLARRKEGNEPAEMIAGVKRYAAYIHAVGSEGTKYVKHAATFFGPDKHWQEEWAVPRNGADRQRAAGGFVG